ncbi:MAG TPA: DedA family protein [Candidatus Saccharimonadales bacterium]|nr:DedA family protein [Candidatus Saccharimonadales bacterium]
MFDFLNGPVRDLVTQIYDAVGYLGVALWVAIESVIIPIPSELVLPFAGFLVGEGAAVEPLTGQAWSYWLTVLAGTLGATAGALVAYGIGAWGGRPLIERWGRYLGITPADLDKADAFFEKHGQAAAFFGRMVPVIRSLVSFAAGISRMPLGRFTLFTFLGSLPWTALLVFAGVQLGANWETVGSVLKRFEYAVLAVLAVIVIGWIWFRIVKPRRAARASA